MTARSSTAPPAAPSKAQADEHALSEFEKFRVIQDRHYISDFNRLEQQANMRDGDDSEKQ